MIVVSISKISLVQPTRGDLPAWGSRAQTVTRPASMKQRLVTDTCDHARNLLCRRVTKLHAVSEFSARQSLMLLRFTKVFPPVS